MRRFFLAWEEPCFSLGGAMFWLTRRGTVIAEGLKVEGRVTAEGLMEVNGQ